MMAMPTTKHNCYHCPPFHADLDDTVTSLYDTVTAKCTDIESPHHISITINGVIILNVPRSLRTLEDVGMHGESNDIQIIDKPDFVQLLEMVFDINNKESIPWFTRASLCLFDSSADHCQNISQFGRGLEFDDDGVLIAIDLSHLNLTGTFHLELLPQSVRSLDLSFNDLESLNVNGLRGKSLQRLNVEHNDRCCLKLIIFDHDPLRSLSLRVLQMSSNQIAPYTMDSIANWMQHQRILNLMIIDNEVISRGISNQLYEGMVKVVDGVKNKWVIPWYGDYFMYFTIPSTDFSVCGISLERKVHLRSRGSQFKFNLSGLGIEGHIDLGSLPRSVVHLDLSDNNLRSISFHGDGKYDLRFLDVRNNSNLNIDLAEIDASSSTCCLFRMVQFKVSSYQLKQSANRLATTVDDYVLKWLQTSTLFEVVVDDRILQLDSERRAMNSKMTRPF